MLGHQRGSRLRRFTRSFPPRRWCSVAGAGVLCLRLCAKLAFSGCSSAASLGFIECDFLAMQATERGLMFLFRGLETTRHDESRLAVALLIGEFRVGGGSVGRDAVALCIGTNGRGRHAHRRKGNASERPEVHVSEVSTSRRASARNSADCISRSLDTVRGNSWASGPSV